MEQSGLTVWGNTKLLTAADRLQLYTLLSKATDLLTFSYALSAGGADLVASPLLKTIETLFPQQKTITLLKPSDPIPQNETIGMLRLADALRVYREENAITPALPALYARYKDDPHTAARTQALLEARAGTRPEARFGKTLAHALYGDAPKMSASRLEQFARCPFAQYLRYGLNAQERKEATERADNVGTFLHDALDAFVKTAQRNGRDLKTLSEDDADAILKEILPPLIAAHNDGIFVRNARLREALIVELRLIGWCVRSLLRQIQTGRFTVAATEASFGMGEGLKPVSLVLKDGTRVTVHGKIDRIDKTADGSMYRIVDYKTGRAHTFDPTKFLSGETIQLPLYLKAAKQLGGEAVGMYYMPLLTEAPEEPGETPKQRLSGVTADDPAAIEASDPAFEKRSDLILNLTRKKDGSLKGDLMDRRSLQALVDRALKIATDNAGRIMDGEASVYPTANACTYCPYDAVCRFDRQLGCKTRATEKRTLAELFAEEEERV